MNFRKNLMKSSFIYLMVLDFSLLASASANAKEAIKVDIETGEIRGQLIVSLCTEETFLQDSCTLARTIVEITNPLTITTLTPPRAGRYTVFVVHDKNGNGKMDKNFFGIPEEPVGLSRNPSPPKFGPPKFKDASFDYLPSKSMEFRIRLVGAE
jgi:uncharacterized protein (DUF2141 family)